MPCAEAAPDGYSVCILPGEPLAFNQFLFKSLAFDPAAFEPVTQLFTIVQALVVGKSLNVNTLSDLLALSKAKPGTLSYSTGAVPFGVFFDRIKRECGADIVKVPFRGGGEAVNSLLTGATPVGFLGLSNVRGQMESGLVTGLMVDSDKRSPRFPDIPTIPRGDGEGIRRALLLRHRRAARHAETDHRQAPGRDRAHRGPGGFSQTQFRRARARPGDQHARGVRPLHPAGPRTRSPGRQGSGA